MVRYSDLLSNLFKNKKKREKFFTSFFMISKGVKFFRLDIDNLETQFNGNSWMRRFNVVALKDAPEEMLHYILSLSKQFYSLTRQESDRLWKVLPVRDIPLGSGNLRITDSTLRVSFEFRITKTCDGVLIFTHYTYNGSEINRNKVYEGTYTNPIKIHWRTLRLQTVGYHSFPGNGDYPSPVDHKYMINIADKVINGKRRDSVVIDLISSDDSAKSSDGEDGEVNVQCTPIRPSSIASTSSSRLGRVAMLRQSLPALSPGSRARVSDLLNNLETLIKNDEA